MPEEIENPRLLPRALKKTSLIFVLFTSCVGIAWFLNSSSSPPSSSSSPSSLSLEQIKSKFKHTRRLHVPETKPDLGKLRLRSLQTNETTPIIGGTLAAPGRYPYFTLVLFLLSSGDIRDFCGGVKINDRIVLTAAHCVDPLAATLRYNSILIAMGNNMDLSSQSSIFSDPNVVTEVVQGIYWSSSYAETPTTLFADYALLELTNPITAFGNVALNSNEAIPADGTTMKAIGFGQTETQSRSFRLLEVDIDALPASACSSAIPGYSNDVMLCAKTVGQGTCFGDSGGPQIITGASAAQDVVVGLTSFGPGTCADTDPNAPEVEARVSWFFPATTTEFPSCDPTPTTGIPTSLSCFSQSVSFISLLLSIFCGL